MINIYAQSFMTATRTGKILVRDVPSTAEKKRHRWFAQPKTRLIDPNKL